MNDHVQKTLKEINEKIAALEELRDGIEMQFGKDAEDGEKSQVVHPARNHAPKKPVRKPSKKVKESDVEGGGENDGPVRIGSLQHRALVEARKSPDPFTAEKMAEALGIDKTSAGQCLLALAKKELIEEVGKDGQMKTYVVKNG